MEQHDDRALEGLGFTPFFRQQLAIAASATSHPVFPARVAVAHRGGAWDCLAARGVVHARAPGRLRHDAADARDLPAVGDWLALREPDGDGSPALVEAVLERRGALVRKAAGRRTIPQVLAANVDTVFVVTSANADFSPGRLARYRAAVEDGGAEALVVISKADLVARSRLDALLDRVPRGMRALALSGATGEGCAALDAELLPGRTVALVGSSGVGKSTLANRLLGEERLATTPIRASDDTGRHTTTRRELVVLPSGACLIDTPGLRELALWIADGGSDDGLVTGDAVAELARGCRFVDCTHQDEPGCAVRAAVEAGELDAREIADHRQLEREAAFQARRQDAALAREHARRWKAIAKVNRARTKGLPKTR
ncbi:MAG: ribosome small subunit-dependent GTPase A [Deltaproteobacteria bacterium]|nr:ribosome small subunit-dependent GTPase A [Deltaproteobacteria bacterium]